MNRNLIKSLFIVSILLSTFFTSISLSAKEGDKFGNIDSGSISETKEIFFDSKTGEMGKSKTASMTQYKAAWFSYENMTDRVVDECSIKTENGKLTLSLSDTIKQKKDKEGYIINTEEENGFVFLNKSFVKSWSGSISSAQSFRYILMSWCFVIRYILKILPVTPFA